MTTEMVLVGVVFFLLVWEVWTFHNERPHDTISEVVRGAAQKWPIITFLSGVLCGHLFWPL